MAAGLDYPLLGSVNYSFPSSSACPSSAPVKSQHSVGQLQGEIRVGGPFLLALPLLGQGEATRDALKTVESWRKPHCGSHLGGTVLMPAAGDNTSILKAG